LSLSSKSGRVAVTLGEVPVAASLEVLEQMLPAMVKILKDPVEADKPKEHTEGGLTGYTATYAGKIDDKPAMVIFVLFEGGKKRALLGNMILIEPETLPKNDDEAFKAFMHSLNGAAQSSEKPAKPADKPAGKSTASSYPKKRPVLSYEVPAGWTTEVDKDDDSISINSEDERISVNFTEVPSTASMELFEQMLPEMVKGLTNPKVTKEAREHTESGLTGFTATYAGKVEDKTMTAIFVLFKAGKDRAILGNMILEDPATLSEEVGKAFGNFMHSLKGTEK
ncbi:MAG: hypothetical protein K8R87_05300, partial [Verrucomicrobia bacterium]|nr:hypothetical protein [Verrucomicrobiota bacterium]